jgi:hypothetical protein
MGKRTYLNVRKPQIHKFLGSFLYRKSANFLGVPVRKSQIRKFLRRSSLQIANQQFFMIYPQISTNTAMSSLFALFEELAAM